jgi:serine/threonine protein kinase
MNTPRGPSPPVFDPLLEAFEAAWQAGAVPRIEDFLPAQPEGDQSERLRRLRELVAVDLERRWRRAAGTAVPATRDALGDRPRLEQYAARYAGLSAVVTAELIGEEYRVRRRWGDRPSQAEYLARFPGQRAQLLALLPRIDAELAEEAALSARPARAAPPALDERPGVVTVTTVAGFMEPLRRYQLLAPNQLEELRRAGLASFPDARALAWEVLRRDWLTPFQVSQILQGVAQELVVGPYLLLERLGEGGTGQVFKACHRNMRRVVALKLIRKDRLADREVVGRFSREMQVVSKLSHPNVVHAFDAGPIGQSLFLVMKYVPGVDLQKLVEQRGPLAVAQACDLIAQAADGLQHVHEQGLVHRDIKPSNLLVTNVKSQGVGGPESSDKNRGDSAAAPCVKILDLGLARLAQPLDAEENATSILTPTGAAMIGTPNYMAPEQAGDFHTADIRADIYSLGCTFYFLLTGQPPFPGGTLAQKIVKHMQAEPPALARPDAPPALALVLRKMMAKRPEDRYQTPGEVARDLATIRAPVGGATDSGPTLLAAPFAASRSTKARWRWGLAVAAVLVVCGGASLWLLRSRGDSERVGRQPTATADVVRSPDGRWRHRGAVRGVTFASGGRLVASGGDDGIRVWDQTLGRQVTALNENGAVSALALVPGKSLLASACAERVVLWETTAWKHQQLPARHAAALRCLVVSPDGKLLATGDQDGVVVLWDLPEGKFRAALKGHSGAIAVLAFSPEGKSLASGGADARIILWNALSGETKATLTGHRRGIRLLGFIQDEALFSKAEDGVWKTWSKGKEVPATGDNLQRPGFQLKDVEAVAISPDRKKAVLAGPANGPIVLLELGTTQFQLGKDKAVGSVQSLAFSPDGQLIVSGSSEGVVQLWETTTGRELLPVAGP